VEIAVDGSGADGAGMGAAGGDAGAAIAGVAGAMGSTSEVGGPETGVVAGSVMGAGVSAVGGGGAGWTGIAAVAVVAAVGAARAGAMGSAGDAGAVTAVAGATGASAGVSGGDGGDIWAAPGEIAIVPVEPAGAPLLAALRTSGVRSIGCSWRVAVSSLPPDWKVSAQI
jgi:hypothetical protein